MIYLKTSIGIEIRGEDLLLSSLQGNLSGGTFTHFKRVADYRHRDTMELRQEIHIFLKNNVLGQDNIVLGIPRRDILLRHLELPAEVADNLKQAIQYQVQSFEPTEEDSYYYDYAVLNRTGKNKRLSILLVMVRRSILDNYLQLMQELGIQPALVTCSTLALTNLFLQNSKNQQDKTYILADVAPSSFELLVLHHGIPVYSQEILKESDLGWKNLILKEINEAASRIRLGPESSIEQIILAGESSEEAYESIKEEIPECALLKNITHLKSTAENRRYLQEAATATGLAHIAMTRNPAVKINLLPAAFRFKQPRWAYISAAVLGIFILVFLAGLFLHRPIQDRQLVEELDREISSLKTSVARVQALRKQTEDLEKEIHTIENLFRKKDANLEVLQELTTILPDDTYLSNYIYRNGSITIGGLSDSATDLIPILENSPLLHNVGQKSGIFRDAQTGKDRFTSIEAELEE
ncbi:MAG: pilus assembly protein PilM [Acidobacteria bacterium]|nr:pilus assembly protein PilM [Acidobacteriota bacterium]